MNIGLISINMYTHKLNFACPIHTYAFQQFLAQNGIATTILDYQPNYFNNFDLEHPVFYYEQRIKKLLNSSSYDEKQDSKKLEFLISQRDAYQSLFREREIRYNKFQQFIDDKYVKTDTCYNSDLLEIEDPGFDCYICVTDVIWKYEPGHGFERGFFLASKAMEGKPKIAYAASRGVPPVYTPEQEAEFLYYIDDFDYISVREKSTQQFINTHSDSHAELVIDPVLLNKRDLYDSIAIKPQEDQYILLYYVMERATDTIQMAVDYARAHNLKIIELTDFPDSTRLDNFEGIDKIYRYDVGVEEWLGYIREAECVFTNSFHGTCFSILFEKNFYVGSRHGDKVTNLLEEVNLSDRRVSSYEEIKDLGNHDIDYSLVNPKLNSLRECSAQFILDAIHNVEMNGRSSYDPYHYDWWKKIQSYQVMYCAGKEKNVSAMGYADEQGCVTTRGGVLVFQSDAIYHNTGYYHFEPCKFSKRGKCFEGWTIRIKIDNLWFYYTKSGTLVPVDDCDDEQQLYIFSDGDAIPFIPINHIASIVATAIWKKGIGDDEKNSFALAYHSGGVPNSVDKSLFIRSKGHGAFNTLSSGNIEYRPYKKIFNTGEEQFPSCGYHREKRIFSGWRVRVRIGTKWFWCLNDGSLIPVSDGAYKAAVFDAGSTMPYIAVNKIESIICEAVWESTQYVVHYNSGMTKEQGSSKYSKSQGETVVLSSGSLEFTPYQLLDNSGDERLLQNRFRYKGYRFVGWRMRIKERGAWYWVVEGEENLAPTKTFSIEHDGPKKLFKENESIPRFKHHDVASIVLEASWEVSQGSKK